MNTFRIEPSGYFRRLSEFTFYTNKSGEKIEITKRNGGITIKCKSYMDDYGNGYAECIIEGFKINEWVCDYAKIGWSWNKSRGFIMLDHGYHPIAISTNYGYGIAQHGLSDFLKLVIQSLMTKAQQAMKAHDSSEDYLKATYGNK